MANNERKSTVQSVAWIRDQHRSRQLDLDPPYQRLSVWNRGYKQFFIDTILRNYPIPPLFLNVEVQDDGTTIHHVIDGKQRLTAILEFLADKFPVYRGNNSPAELAGKYFSQFPAANKRAFYGYYLPVEIFDDVDTDEVTEIFERFNRNVARLNPQELRHARYNGKFITLMEQLVEEPIWRELGVFTAADVRRMRDVEYISTIFSLTMHGLEEGDSLDQHFADYDEEIPDVGDHLSRYANVKLMIEKLGDVVKDTRLNNRGDFYSLWSALLEFADDISGINFVQTELQLTEFTAKVDSVPILDEPMQAGEDAVLYSQAVRAGTTKLSNREERKQILLKYISLQ